MFFKFNLEVSRLIAEEEFFNCEMDRGNLVLPSNLDERSTEVTDCFFEVKQRAKLELG